MTVFCGEAFGGSSKTILLPPVTSGLQVFTANMVARLLVIKAPTELGEDDDNREVKKP